MTNHVQHKRPRYGLFIGLGIVLLGLVGLVVYQVQRHTRMAAQYVIADHIEQLHKILTTIDDQCGIVSIAHDRNYLDFLQVAKFVGNQVGPLQLRNPEKWAGPYVEQTPTVQGKVYELNKVRDGYAITPGTGVRLDNKKVVGTDIIVSPEIDIDTLLTPEMGFEFDGRPLARKFELRADQTASEARERFILSDE